MRGDLSVNRIQLGTMRSPASLYPLLLAIVDVGLGALLYWQDAVVLGAALAALGAVVLIGLVSQMLRDHRDRILRRLRRVSPSPND